MTPLKIRAIFSTKPFPKPRQIWKFAKLVSENTGLSRNAVKKMLKNGVFWAEWSKSGLSWVQVGCKYPKESPCKTSRFEGLLWFGGGIIPLGGRRAIYGGFSGVYGEGRKSFIPNRGLLPPYEGLCPKNLRQNFSGEKSGRKKGALLRAPPKGEIMN